MNSKLCRPVARAIRPEGTVYAPGARADECSNAEPERGWHRSGSGFCALLSDLYVLCLESLGTFFDFEPNRLAFLQAAESIGLDLGVMDEHVALAACTADKTKSLCVVKPLHCSLFHKTRVPSY